MSANRSTTRARLGKGCGTSTKAPREELLVPPNALGQHVGAPAGWAEVKLGLLARASRTTPTPERTMPPSHLTAKRIRRRTQRRRAVASQTTSAMRPPRRRGGRRVPAAGPSSVAGPASPSWPARLPTREDRARGQILGKMACLRNLQSNIARDGGRMTRSSLHSRLRAEILHGIDTWNVFSIARGEELRPFSTCVQRR